MATLAYVTFLYIRFAGHFLLFLQKFLLHYYNLNYVLFLLLRLDFLPSKFVSSKLLRLSGVSRMVKTVIFPHLCQNVKRIKRSTPFPFNTNQINFVPKEHAAKPNQFDIGSLDTFVYLSWMCCNVRFPYSLGYPIR